MSSRKGSTYSTKTLLMRYMKSVGAFVNASVILGFVSSASRVSYHGNGEASDLVSKTNNTSQAKKMESTVLAR
jgi:hypothetical protein